MGLTDASMNHDSFFIHLVLVEGLPSGSVCVQVPKTENSIQKALGDKDLFFLVLLSLMIPYLFVV